MDDFVPGTLQRLRAADIIHIAGLAVASLGQEYCRIGAVQATMRQGARLHGIVDTSKLAKGLAISAEDRAQETETLSLEHHQYVVEVEVQSANLWLANCTCHAVGGVICQHGAALLYQWLAHPLSFAAPPTQTPAIKREETVPISSEQQTELKLVRQRGKKASAGVLRGPTPSNNLPDILSQLGLSELRNIAREYDIATTGLNKQQLADAIKEMLLQPEVVRRMASGLEKQQRQLLATLTLAGGSMTDDDLRGLFERFAFGQGEKLQDILLALQSKALLFHTSLIGSPQQRIGLSGALFDVGWTVPAEVRTALHVLVPVTPFAIQEGIDGDSEPPRIQQVEPYSLLADLLLVARALNGYRLGHEESKDERGATNSLRSLPPYAAGSLTNDGTGAIAAPGGLPSTALIECVQAVVPRPAAFLRYAIRLLRLADLLHKDDAGTPYLRLLPNTARLLLGPTRAEVARDLFELWLTQAGYDELFELQEEGLRLRCRTTPLNQPILRTGELEAENAEARQILVALVAQAPLNQWISFPAFARFIYRLNPTFLQRRQRLFPSPHWWLEHEEGRSLQPAQMNDWMRAEGHYLARLLRGPLHWWGLSDLALSSEGRLLAFRLTPLAGLLLNGEEPDEYLEEWDSEYLECPASQLEALESGEMLITCTSAVWPLIETIEDFAEVAGVRDNRLCYQLAPKSLAEALGRGQHATVLLDLLRQAVTEKGQKDGPLVRLLAQIEQWTTSYGRVRLYTGVSLLEAADPLIMRELAATTSVEEQVVQAITPTLVILKKQGTERLIEDLKRRGQVPLLHEKDYYGAE